MASYSPPIKNAQFIFYISLYSQSVPRLMQTNPTLAAGDVKVSTDGGAFANIATLPVVTPSGGVAVKVTLSASEMNGDNVVVSFQDAAGSEWNDVLISIHTAAQSLDTIDANIDAILADTGTDGVALSSTVLNAIADAILKRGISNTEGACDDRSLTWALAKLVNKILITGSSLSIKKTDDSTELFSQTVSSDSGADPVTGLDTV